MNASEPNIQDSSQSRRVLAVLCRSTGDAAGLLILRISSRHRHPHLHARAATDFGPARYYAHFCLRCLCNKIRSCLVGRDLRSSCTYRVGVLAFDALRNTRLVESCCMGCVPWFAYRFRLRLSALH